VYDFITKVSGTSAPVLILGESGTGKEMAAQAIHVRSSRRDAPFVAINCGAIPESLLESELFGHEKGSFTGAHAQRKGRVETAEGGTLFLDEIGEMPIALQVKLLRFLQERKIERIGGRVSIGVDVRIIAATNQELERSIAEGRFREDLYYRLNVVNITMPPLKDRPGDVQMLAQSFLNQFAREHGKPAPKFTLPAQRALEHHDWPGNVRELQNRVRRAFIMHEGASIHPEDLELVDTGPKEARSLKAAREDLERGMVIDALRRNQGKISHAASELGVSRPTLYELMEKLGIKNEERPGG
jgi:two-component system NtrC family response regulator